MPKLGEADAKLPTLLCVKNKILAIRVYSQIKLPQLINKLARLNLFIDDKLIRFTFSIIAIIDPMGMKMYSQNLSSIDDR